VPLYNAIWRNTLPILELQPLNSPISPVPPGPKKYITAFLEAKMRDAETSVALYSVSSDVDGAKIVQQMGVRLNKAIVRMLETARERLTTDPRLVASMLQAAMVGVSRRMLESGAPEEQFESLRRELIVLACAYLDASSERPSIIKSAGTAKRTG